MNALLHHSLKYKPRRALNFSVINVVYSDMHTNRWKHSLLLWGKGQSNDLLCTLDDLKQNAVDLTSAFSLSISSSDLSSVRLRYFPVVTCRSLNGWPQRMWLPLHLDTEAVSDVSTQSSFKSIQNKTGIIKRKQNERWCLFMEKKGWERNSCEMKIRLCKAAKKCALWMLNILLCN